MIADEFDRQAGVAVGVVEVIVRVTGTMRSAEPVLDWKITSATYWPAGKVVSGLTDTVTKRGVLRPQQP